MARNLRVGVSRSDLQKRSGRHEYDKTIDRHHFISIFELAIAGPGSLVALAEGT
jgi:hypothetical protein